MSSNIRRDSVHRLLPIREFAAWLIGGMVGLYIGVQVGLIIENNIGPVIGGALGWFIGIIIGTLISDFVAVKTNTSRLIAVSWGPIAGLILGTAMGMYVTKRLLQKEGQNTIDKDGD